MQRVDSRGDLAAGDCHRAFAAGYITTSCCRIVNMGGAGPRVGLDTAGGAGLGYRRMAVYGTAKTCGRGMIAFPPRPPSGTWALG